jgi:saccharopine dehydrogenase-like NADP-dependent oxidoreductase
MHSGSVTSYLVLGGAGDMGSSVVTDLVFSRVEEVRIGDYNISAAEKIADRFRKEVADTKVTASFLDVNDRRKLTEEIADSDIVINTVGPFYKYEKIVIDSAIEAERDYVDICDDYDATLESFSKEEEIRKGKSRILIGMGWTPGITNVCAKAGYDELDEVSDINIAWSGSASDAAGIAVISHVLHAVTGDVPMYLDGRLEYVPARQFKREIEFPEPINKIETYFVGHPEPVTIPKFLKNLRNVTLRGALVPDWHNHLVSQLADIGLTEDRTVKVWDKEVSARDFLASFVHQTMEQFRSGGVEMSGFWVEVLGRKNGKETVIEYSGAERMSKLTGWSASIGAQFITKNKQILPGLYAPEGCINPSYFFGELARRNIRVKRVKKTIEIL